MLKGIPASTGIGIGKVLLYKQGEILAVRRTIKDKESEKMRIQLALDEFCKQIYATAEIVSNNIGIKEAEIISTQAIIANDPELKMEIDTLIDEKSYSAEYALSTVCNGYIDIFSSLDDELMRSRSADFHDIKQRMLSILLKVNNTDMENISRGSILVAEDISPSQAAILDPRKVMGVVTHNGTRYSHIAIIARALQIPTVVAVENLWSWVAAGDKLIVDGGTGDVFVNPNTTQISLYQKRRREERKLYQNLLDFRERKTYTSEGKRIRLNSNFALLPELSLTAENNVDGIGLFRTEFLYMNSTSLPTDEVQFKAYKRIAHAMDGKPVIMRTLDIGGDKNLTYLEMKKEENPYMGNRAIRFCLANTDIFKTQISAMLRASIYGNLSIMLPMISTITELRDAKTLINTVKRELNAQNIPYNKNIKIGIMIETPAAAICADMLAQEADFFSIGTNDLTQYTLAVDRNNESVANLYAATHPAVLRLINMTITAAKNAGIPVDVCGEAAADSTMIPILVGMGIGGLSVSSSCVLKVREQIAKISATYWQNKIAEILCLNTTYEVAQFVRDN